MFRTTVFPIATAATLGLLCASSSAQDRDDVQEVGENAPLCMAVDPIVGSDRRSYYQLVQKQFVWKVGDGLQPESKDKIKIGVFFIDGTDDQKRDVMYYMREWIESTEAPIEWVFGRKEHIKIRFNVPDNKSLYGNQAATQFLSDGISTMHLGVYNQANVEQKYKRRVALHEFGHALGLMHEHLHPQSGLHFIDENVVADMTARHWCDGLAPAGCLAKVRDQITRPALGDHACRGAEKYDSKSIMHYPIEKTWTHERREVPLNTHLSDGDVACVRNLYLSPAPPLPPPETPKPKPPISHGCPPPIWACCGCCGRCVSARNQCTISRPRLPPRWVRGFWTEWWDDEW